MNGGGVSCGMLGGNTGEGISCRRASNGRNDCCCWPTWRRLAAGTMAGRMSRVFLRTCWWQLLLPHGGVDEGLVPSFVSFAMVLPKDLRSAGWTAVLVSTASRTVCCAGRRWRTVAYKVVAVA